MGKENEYDAGLITPDNGWRMPHDAKAPAGLGLVGVPSAAPYASGAVRWEQNRSDGVERERPLHENRDILPAGLAPMETAGNAAPYKKSPNDPNKLTWGWSGRQMQKILGGNISEPSTPAGRAMQKLETENAQMKPVAQQGPAFQAEPRLHLEGGMGDLREKTIPITPQEAYSDALLYGGLSPKDQTDWVNGIAKTPVGQFMHPVLLRGASGVISTPVKIKNVLSGEVRYPEKTSGPEHPAAKNRHGLVQSSIDTDQGMAPGDYLQMVSDGVKYNYDELIQQEPYQKNGKTTRFGHTVNLAGWGAEKVAGNWLGKTGKVMDAANTVIDAKSAYNEASANRLRELEKMDDATLCIQPRYKAACDRLKEYDLSQRAAIIRYGEAKRAGEEAFQKKLVSAGLMHLVDKASGRLDMPKTLRYFAQMLKEAGIAEIEEPLQSIRGLLADEEGEE